ncbi:MAG TPA: tyrosine-protein phosphatase [Dehalococcoidia bacterium]|nr:tyrosine-protein phosphatase [Dehalococcoidia bacterium]
MTAEASAPPRFIEFERCFNFRDIGGYVGRDGRRVRWGRLYRSMTPEYMTPADVEKARKLGIGFVFDIRGWLASSGPLGEPPGRRFAHRPRRRTFWTPDMVQAYRQLPPEVQLPQVVDRLGRAFAKAVALMADEESATLFHCRLGKDRSGVFAALLLKLLGVGDEDVIAEYLLSGNAAEIARPLVTEDGDDPTQSESRVVREPATRHLMELTLARLRDEYGGAYAYLHRHGVPKYKLNRFIERTLEPAGS